MIYRKILDYFKHKKLAKEQENIRQKKDRLKQEKKFHELIATQFAYNQTLLSAITIYSEFLASNLRYDEALKRQNEEMNRKFYEEMEKQYEKVSKS